jgi:hypothetical protein
MKAIVYVSETGHAKKYAEMLGEKTGLPVYQLEEALKTLEKNAEVVYIGWVFGGQVYKYKKAAKAFNIKVLCAVGSAPAASNSYSGDLGKTAAKAGAKFFYLRGGLDLEKLTGYKKAIMKMVAKSVVKALSKKQDQTPEDKETIDSFTNGIDYVSVENLAPVIEFLSAK